MNEKEELIIELEKKYEAKKSRLEELSEDELAKVSGGDGVVFEKGKWIQYGPGPFGADQVYELLELKGDEILHNTWINFFGKAVCVRDKLLPVAILDFATEIARPDWAHE